MAVLSLCPSCGSALLQPLRSRPAGDGEMLVDLQGIRHVQFDIVVGVDEFLDLLAIHERPPLCGWVERAVCNCLRARVSRDITVPIGTPAISAISL